MESSPQHVSGGASWEELPLARCLPDGTGTVRHSALELPAIVDPALYHPNVLCKVTDLDIKFNKHFTCIYTYTYIEVHITFVQYACLHACMYVSMQIFRSVSFPPSWHQQKCKNQCKCGYYIYMYTQTHTHTLQPWIPVPQEPVLGALAPMSVSEGCFETKTPPISPSSWFTWHWGCC